MRIIIHERCPFKPTEIKTYVWSGDMYYGRHLPFVFVSYTVGTIHDTYWVENYSLMRPNTAYHCAFKTLDKNHLQEDESWTQAACFPLIQLVSNRDSTCELNHPPSWIILYAHQPYYVIVLFVSLSVSLATSRHPFPWDISQRLTAISLKLTLRSTFCITYFRPISRQNLQPPGAHQYWKWQPLVA